MKASEQTFLPILLSLILIVIKDVKSLGDTCGLPDKDGVTKIVITASSPIGVINLYTVQFDTVRKLPVTSTALHNALNQQKTAKRLNTFRMYEDCEPVREHEMNCARSFKFTPEQSAKSGHSSFDRGHLVPANPNKFSIEAQNNTFYCVNMAPQDPYVNQGPWVTVETLALNKFKTFPGFVMTGLCDADSSDGPTKEGYATPACYWKLICYKDQKNEEITQVVGFIANNTIVNNRDTAAHKLRSKDVTTPRSQSDIEKVTRPKYIENAWMDAAKDLLVGRIEEGAPDPLACIAAKTLTLEARLEFNQRRRTAG